MLLLSNMKLNNAIIIIITGPGLSLFEKIE